MIGILVENKSLSLTGREAELGTWVAAIGRQMAHVAELWSIVPPAIAYAPTGGIVPELWARVTILDDTDQASALGYHAEMQDGLVFGRVFCAPALAAGESISAVLSHEILEMVGDAHANTWADGPDGTQYARELCDPVEAQTYAVDGVLVSNFVGPAWFDPAAQNERFDWLGTVGGPFTISPGGYTIRRTLGNNPIHAYGLHVSDAKRIAKYSDWARGARRRRR